MSNQGSGGGMQPYGRRSYGGWTGGMTPAPQRPQNDMMIPPTNATNDLTGTSGLHPYNQPTPPHAGGPWQGAGYAQRPMPFIPGAGIPPSFGGEQDSGLRPYNPQTGRTTPPPPPPTPVSPLQGAGYAPRPDQVQPWMTQPPPSFGGDMTGGMTPYQPRMSTPYYQNDPWQTGGNTPGPSAPTQGQPIMSNPYTVQAPTLSGGQPPMSTPNMVEGKVGPQPFDYSGMMAGFNPNSMQGRARLQAQQGLASAPDAYGLRGYMQNGSFNRGAAVNDYYGALDKLKQQGVTGQINLYDQFKGADGRYNGPMNNSMIADFAGGWAGPGASGDMWTGRRGGKSYWLGNEINDFEFNERFKQGI